MKTDVLIVTVTKVESQAVLEVFKEATGQTAKTIEIDGRIYRDLGSINSTQVFMVRSEMGASGLGAALQTIQKGIESLSPSAVIMVGIAFGIDSARQSIGDILVSQRLMLYDLQRVGTDKDGKARIIPRGDRATAPTRLIDRFRNADEDWREPRAKVYFGLILCGEKLVDNLDFRQNVLELEPEAIGGEMEGAGLYTACQANKVDWILVKGICDWADGKKEEDRDQRQKLAAHNAASFVVHALRQAPLKGHAKSSPELPPTAVSATGGPLANPVAHRKSRSTLPLQPYFFGREKELATIADALSPESRSWGVLIDGPGGIGKTALAIRAAYLASEEQFADKIFLSAKKRELTPAGEQPLEDFMLPNYLYLLSELAKEIGEEELSLTPPNERANAVRRALTERAALIVVDNVESFEEPERVRLYQFLARLPGKCKAIVTSRRRSDIDARVIRLDRLLLNEALDLMAELAKTNKYLSRASEKERPDLYEITHGNPLLIKWTVAQLGRQGSKCRTIADAYKFLQSAPKDNDPLEYIFGDLLGTFTESETSVLAALVHFSQPAKVEWIAELAKLAPQVAQTALEDLTDRALLVSDEPSQAFLLPTLAATFLRRKRPEAVASTASRLADRTYALVTEHGGQNFEGFSKLEAQWPAIAAALPVFLQGDNAPLQRLCYALDTFLDFSGRWDESLSLSLNAEEKAIASSDFHKAGWRALDAGWVFYLRQQAVQTAECATRCEEHWQKAAVGASEKAAAIQLRGHGYLLQRDYPRAIAAYQECLALYRTVGLENTDVAISMNWLASAEGASGDNASAERDFREALRIAKKVRYEEGIATATGNLAEMAIERQDWPEAETLASEALSAAQRVGRLQIVASNSLRLALSLARQKRVQEALPFARRASEIYARLRHANLGKAQALLQECEQVGALAAKAPTMSSADTAPRS